MRVAVLGAGAWGSALAALLADTGHDVLLWDRDGAVVDRLRSTREHPYLGIRLPARVSVVSHVAEAVERRELLVVATPSEGVRDTVVAARPVLTPGAVVVCASKGLEAGSRATMEEVIRQSLPGAPVALLSGPTFAKEIASGLPAAVVAAAREAPIALAVQRAFSSERLRVYTTDDVVGVAIGGALKNVVAIAVGVSDGLGFGDNARAALITRGLSEMGRLAVKLGAHPLTMAGLAGLGDLVLTCTGDLSRNRQVGLALARGDSLPEVLARLGQVAEGTTTAQTAASLADELGVELPITARVAAVLSGGESPREAVSALLARDPRAERD